MKIKIFGTDMPLEKDVAHVTSVLIITQYIDAALKHNLFGQETTKQTNRFLYT